MPNSDDANLGQGATDSAASVSTADVTAAATDLHTLIDTLCPDGVEWKALGDIFTMRNGYTPSKSEPSFWEGGTIPWFRMEDIRNNGNILADSIQHVTPAAVKGKLFPAGSIILATTATIGVHALLTSDSLANQQFTFFTKRELPGCDIDMKFMFYYFFIVDEWCKKHIKVSSFPAVDVPALAKLKVPVPPLAVQAKIVQILDKFTELAKELAKEKQARRTQHEYYRDWLLDLAHPEGKQGEVWDLLRTLCPDGVEWKTLGDIGKFYGGLTGKCKQDFVDGNAQFITYKNVYNNPATDLNEQNYVHISETEKQHKLEYGDIIFTGSSENTFDCAMSSVIVKKPTRPIYLNSFCFIFRLDNPSILLPEFSKYIFRCQQVRKQLIKTVNGVTRFNVSKVLIGKVTIPVPPLPVQAEIVRILDQFSTLAEDITAGLPAEIAARQTQYEHYRNQLLSFKER